MRGLRLGCPTKRGEACEGGRHGVRGGVRRAAVAGEEASGRLGRVDEGRVRLTAIVLCFTIRRKGPLKVTDFVPLELSISIVGIFHVLFVIFMSAFVNAFHFRSP